jgi:hypothetical protein
MANLLSLPSELIDNIAEQLLPGSIEAFALSCKTIYGKCRYTLDKHQEYRAKYKIWSNHGPRRDDLFYFLCAIESDPLLAGYVETFSFWDRRSDEDIIAVRKGLGATWRTWKNVPKLETVVSMVETKLGAYFEALSIDTGFWYNQINLEVNRRGCRSGDFILEPDRLDTSIGYAFFSALTLLCLLPNLKELGLHPDFPSSFDQQPHYILLSIRQLFRYRPLDGTYPLPYRPLEKLETLLPYQSDCGDEIIPLEHIRPFLELPALKNVYSTSGAYEPEDDNYLEDGFHLDYAPGWIETPQGFHPQWESLQLRRLELYDSCLSPHGLLVLLHCCTQLEVLRYLHSSKRGAIGANWSVGACVDAMGKTVGQSLKELYLRLRFDLNSIDTAIESFTCFPALETLETDVVLFTDTTITRKPPGSLESMLPPSIRNIRLHFKDGDHDSWVQSLVNGLATARKDRLTNIEEVSIRNYTTFTRMGRASTRPKEDYAEVQQLAEGEGVEWLDDTSNLYPEHWGGWPGDYRRMFASSIEEKWYYDDSEDE